MLKIALAIILSCAAAQAGEFTISGPFSGLNDTDAAITLLAGEAQSILNVEVARDGQSIKKRSGYTLDSTLTITTAPVYGSIMFTDSASRKIKLFANDRAVFASIDGGAYSAITSTFTAGAKWSFCDAGGEVFAFNSAHDTPFSYNGTGLEYYESMPKASICASAPTRLLLAGTTDFPNRLYFSEQGNYTNFTLNTAPEDPSFDDIGLAGEKITALFATESEWIIAKTNSMISYQGTNQYDLIGYLISNRIGMSDPHAIVEHEGQIYFMDSVGDIYSYTSCSATKIDGKIETFVSNITKGPANLITYNTQGDFATGTVDHVTTSAYPGSVQPIEYQTIDTTNADFTAGSTLGSTVTISGDTLYLTAGITSGTYTSAWKQATAPTPRMGKLYTSSSGGSGNTITYSYRSSSSTIYSPATEWVTGVLNDTVSPSTNTYWQFKAVLDNTASPTANRVVLNAMGMYMYASTGTWTEAEKYIGSMTSWGTFNVTEEEEGVGHWVYTMRVSTFSGGTSLQAGTVLTNGAAITASTGNYVSTIAKYTMLAPTETVRLSNLSYKYNLTTDKQAVAFEYKDDIYFSMPYGNYAYNNRILKLDTKSIGWQVFDIPMNSPIVDGENIYFGSPTGGYIYRYPSGNSDNGAAINSYWKTQDFLGAPYTEKEYGRISSIAKSDTGTTLDYTYTIDTSSSISFSVDLTTTTQSYYRHNRQLSYNSIGTIISLQVGNNSDSQPWTFYGATIEYKDKPWRVYP